MTIASFYARNMPRQTADSSVPPRIARRRPPAFPRMGGEGPDLSADMKRRIMVERVARELFENLLFTGSDTPVALEVRRALNREFGEELFFQYLPGSPGMAVLHDTPRGREEVPPATRADVLERAWAITLDKVDETML